MDPKTQVEAARHSVLAVARPDLTTLEVAGEDRVSWLNGMLTCDLLKRAPGEAPYGLAVARSGRELADAVAIVEGSLAGVPGSSDAGGAGEGRTTRSPITSSTIVVMEDVELAQKPGEWVTWALHGPGSADVLTAADEDEGRTRGPAGRDGPRRRHRPGAGEG